MNEDIKHIVFLSPGFAESENDSTTIPALQVFLKSLRKIVPNARLTLLTFQFPFTNKIYDWHGIEVIPLNGKNKRLKKLRTWKKASNTLKKIHKEKKIDAIHSFWIGECSMIAQRFAKKHSIKHIVTVMGQDATVKNAFAKNLINSSAKIVTLSENHKKELLCKNNIDSIIIPWYLDVSTFPNLQETTMDILGVGSLNTVKNYIDFIEVISVLEKKHKNLKVIIIGEGKLKAELEVKIEQLDLKNTITLLGKQSRSKVLEYMAQSKILLHTSMYESFGFVFLEALYSGMQIISYDVGFASPSKKWAICKNKLQLIKTCETQISKSKKEKQRLELSSEKESINTYLNLYNA